MSIIDKGSDSEEVFFPQAKGKAKAKGKDMLMIEDRKVIIIVFTIRILIIMFIVFMIITIITNLTVADMGYVSINDYKTRRPTRTTRPSWTCANPTCNILPISEIDCELVLDVFVVFAILGLQTSISKKCLRCRMWQLHCIQSIKIHCPMYNYIVLY